MRLTLDPDATWTLQGLLMEFCLRIKDDWLPDHLRLARPRLCAIYESLHAHENAVDVDRQDVEALREACRFVVDEIGPNELDIIHSMSLEDARELDTALEQLERG